jgi:hypothetical protein
MWIYLQVSGTVVYPNMTRPRGLSHIGTVELLPGPKYFFVGSRTTQSKSLHFSGS